MSSNSVIRTLAVALAFSCSSLAIATDYFVDSRSGNDASSGLSPESAWKTLERVSTSSELVGGDVVHFRSGEFWRGGLKPCSGEEGKPIVYTSYGDGAKPSFWRSVSLAKENDWTKVGDNLWATRETSVRKIGDGGSILTGGWALHQESGAKVAYRQEKSEKGGTAYTFDCANCGTASNHVQWMNSSFAIEKGRAYRISFDVVASEDVPLRLSLMKNGSPWTSYGVNVIDKVKASPKKSRQSVVVKTTADADDARVTVYLGGLPEGLKLTISDFEVEEVEVDALSLGPDVGNIILDGRKAAFKRWTLEDLKAQDDFCYERGDGRVWFYSDVNPALKYKSLEAATMSHVINLSNVHDAVFDGLDIRYGSAHGFGGSANTRVVIRNCDICWIGGGDQYLEGGAGRRTRYGNGIEFWASASDHLVENCRIWEVYDAAITNQGAGTNQERNIVYRNNLIWNCEYSFEYWNRDETSVTENIEFVDNVCLNAGYGWGHVQRPDKNGRCLMFYSNTAQTKNFVVKNNVFANATESLVRSDVEWTPEEPQLIGNTYWQDDASLPFVLWRRNTVAKDQFDAWRAETKQEDGAKVERVDAAKLIPDLK